VSFATITLCVASQQVYVVLVYFVIDSVWKLLETPLYSYIADKKRSPILILWMKCHHQSSLQEEQVKEALKEAPRRKPLVWMEYCLIYVGTENLKKWRSKHQKVLLMHKSRMNS